MRRTALVLAVGVCAWTGQVAWAQSAAARVPGVVAPAPATVVEDGVARNTSIGAGAMPSVTTGTDNTASGWQALAAVGPGSENTASGSGALSFSYNGSRNTAIGTRTLAGNATGTENSAVGFEALNRNLLGGWNTALGASALYWSVSSANTAVGYGALRFLSQGGGANTAIGYLAGGLLDEGTSNIYIGTNATGTGIEHFTTRIGAPVNSGGAPTRVFITGIHGTTLTAPATAVYIDANGQLGTVQPPSPPPTVGGGGSGASGGPALPQEAQDRIAALEDLVRTQAADLAALRERIALIERSSSRRR